MKSWSKFVPHWIALALMPTTLIMGNSASFVDDFFDSEPQITELVDVENNIKYKGFSGNLLVPHPEGRSKRQSSSKSKFYDGSAWVFLNIPYVEPIDNASVFQPPTRFEEGRFQNLMDKRHEDEANYRRFGNFCPQPESNLTEYYRNYCFSEMAIDCLNLNVFTPVLTNVTKSELFPVYVLFHGGKLSHGSSCDFGRQGLIQNFVVQEIIVVTVNYRLGLYGYLPNGTSDLNNSPRGLKDQIEALRWVQDHIHAFKGNNKSVTLGGFDSGACSAALIMEDHDLISAEQPLFKNVILHGATSLNCVEDSVLDQNVSRSDFDLPAIANDIALHNSLVQGFTDQDPGVDYSVTDTNSTLQFFEQYVRMGNNELGSPQAGEAWDTELSKVFEIYDLDKKTKNPTSAMQLLTDYVFTYNLFSMANQLVNKGHNVSIYRFNHAPDPKLFADFPSVKENEVPHGTDFRYAYLPIQYWQSINDSSDEDNIEKEKHLSRTMSNILFVFIHSGPLKSLSSYRGNVGDGMFTDIDGDEGKLKSLKVSTNLLTQEKFDLWKGLYTSRLNRTIAPVFTPGTTKHTEPIVTTNTPLTTTTLTTTTATTPTTTKTTMTSTTPTTTKTTKTTTSTTSPTTTPTTTKTTRSTTMHPEPSINNTTTTVKHKSSFSSVRSKRTKASTTPITTNTIGGDTNTTAENPLPPNQSTTPCDENPNFPDCIPTTTKKPWPS
ncbi:carboxylesterase family domain-containing protein [Ditylenchus destructor]|nr:carboxylesterase family domain-containing protein [Ditylenchus destructor]